MPNEIFFFFFNVPENSFYISPVLNVGCGEFLVEARPRCTGTSTRTRMLFTIPPAVAPTNKSALAVARMEIFKTKDLNGQFFIAVIE